MLKTKTKVDLEPSHTKTIKAFYRIICIDEIDSISVRIIVLHLGHIKENVKECIS